LLPSGRFFKISTADCHNSLSNYPGRGISRKYVFSAGNYQPMDEKNSRGMIIPPGIASSWRRNPTEDGNSTEESTSSWTRHFMDADSGRQDQNPPNGNNPRISDSKCSLSRIPTFFQKLNVKICLKWKIHLIRPYHELQKLSNEIKKNLVRLNL
jgi:hypothetical protein